jgi:hypothetical protein
VPTRIIRHASGTPTARANASKKEENGDKEKIMNIIQPFERLEACFGELAEPRVEGRCEHVLIEIILVAVLWQKVGVRSSNLGG